MKIYYLFIASLWILSSIKSQTVSCNTSFLNSDWNCIGPFEYEKSNMGRVYAVWADPANTNHIYVGTGASGLWETTDGGDNWHNVISDDFPALGVWDIKSKYYGSVMKIFLSTMHFSKLNIMNLGFLYYNADDDVWLEPLSYPDYTTDKYDFLQAGPVKKLGFRQMFVRPETDELWIANGQNLFKWDMLNEDWWYGTYYDPPVTLDEDGTPNPKHTVNEIVFAPDDNTRAIVTSHNGIEGDVLFTENADDPDPTWYQIPTPYTGLFTLATGDTYVMNTTASIAHAGDAYILATFQVLRSGTFTFEKYVRIYEYSLPVPGGSAYPVLNRTIDITNDPLGTFHQLYVLNDGSNSFIIADNTSALYKGTLPVSDSSDISLTQISANNGSSNPWGNTHTDIRDTYIIEDIYGSIDKIYIATDGGVSMCDDFYSMTSGLNDDIWQNLNGYGLTITECNGFSNSEFEAYEILQSSPDGNNFIYNTKPGAAQPEFQQIVYQDGYDGAITNVYDPTGLSRKAVYNGNSNGARDPSKMYIIDLYSSELIPLVPATKSVPKSRQSTCTDCEVCPENCLQHNYAYKPASYEFDLTGSQFWTGTSDIFCVDDPHNTSSDWQPLSKTFATLKYLDTGSELANENVISYTPITAYKKADNYPANGQTTIYYATQHTKGGYVYTRDGTAEYDNIKIVRAVFKDNPGPDDDYFATDITPVVDEIAGSGTYNQINESFITDMVIDSKEPWQIWVSFGANALGGENRILDECLDDNHNAKKGRVYYSTDAGATWSNRSDGLPNYPVLSLCYWEGSNDIIFAGTEVGVYIWNVSENRWECFNENMPYCSISDLEINYCTMHLRAAVFGFGIWETPLPTGAHYSRPGAQPIEITSDVTWNYSRDAQRDIIVKPGATLTIQNCEIRMPKDHIIIVERGAALILDNATITNHCDAWMGIEVWGNTSKTHPAGPVPVTSGTYPAAPDDQGVVYLKPGSKIENSTYGIYAFKTTPGGENVNYRGGIIIADQAEFVNNTKSVHFQPYNSTNISYFKDCSFVTNNEYFLETLPQHQVYFYGIRDIHILGCDFVNELSHTDHTIRGTAIYATDAYFTVDKGNCLDIFNPCGNYDISTFTGYYRAIEVANTTPGTSPVTISNNLFTNNDRGILLSNVRYGEVLENTFEIADDTVIHQYGLYLEDCQDYHVEGNVFTKSATAVLDSVSPLMAGIYVNNNSTKATEIYRNTFEDLEAGIRCQSTNTKLQIKCNTFNNVMEKYAIYLTSGTLADQGKCLSAAYPAVDRAKAPAGNIFNNTCTGSLEQHIKVLSDADPFVYKHHTDRAPLCYTTTKVTLNSCSYSSASLGEACPSTLTGGTESSSYLLGEINSNSSEIESMENAMALESEATDLDELEYLQLQNEYLIQQLVETYQQTSETDSAILLLQNLEEFWAKEYLVDIYIGQNDLESAQSVLKSINNVNVETDNYKMLYSVYIEMLESGRSIESLTEKELEMITSIAGKQSAAGIAAENILQHLQKTDIPEIFDVETAEEMRYANTEITSAIKVFPNPTDNALFIDLTVITETQIPVCIIIYNLIGNKILELELQAGIIQKVVLNDFSTGIYLLQCYQEDMLLHAENVMVE